MNNPFFLSLASTLLGLLLSMPLHAQEITAERNVLVQGYSVFEGKRPMAITPWRDQQFVFLEYWKAGMPTVKDTTANKELVDIRRKQTSYHLQSFGIQDMRERFFYPVNATALEQGEEGDSANVVQGQDGQVDPTQVLSMREGVAVVGTRVGNGGGPPQTVVNFFDKDGSPMLESLVQLSSFTKKKSKTYQEWVAVSPNGKYLLWLAQNGKTYAATLVDDKGEEIWFSEDLPVPYRKEGYIIADVEVSDEGIANLVIRRTKVGGSPLILLRYQDTTDVFLEQPLLGGAEGIATHAELYMLKDGEAVTVATFLQMGADSASIQNGINLETQSAFSHIGICAFKPTFGTLMQERYTQLHPVPEEWITHYRERGGANFSKFQVVGPSSTYRDGKHLVFLMEEIYKGKKLWFFKDLAMLTFSLTDGSIAWKHRLEKAQRDRGEKLMSYVAGVSRERLRIVYITEMGARGQLVCKSYNMDNGQEKSRVLASNSQSAYLFLPAQSGMVSSGHMVLLGLGNNPAQNGYKMITISF